MSLWWAKRDQLDQKQVDLIEKLDLEESFLVLGPPGSGKTNVLLRRAQFVRTQDMPNVLVLTFTRSLTEFLRTGCYNAAGSEIFPPAMITTLEAWQRTLYKSHGIERPEQIGDQFVEYKRQLANGAIELCSHGKHPKFDAMFVDEAQDLLPEEVELLSAWSNTLFFVGDSRQQIYDHADGLGSIRKMAPAPHEETLPFHYRLAPEICEMADRILRSTGGSSLSKTSHYNGPRPGRIDIHHGPRAELIVRAADSLKSQLRAYGDTINLGDRLGVVVPRKDDREVVLQALEADPNLAGKAQIIRARTGESDDIDYSPALDPASPILIMTEQACKGLEFRALHWLFVETASWRTDERYYTVVTRAKTSLDIYHSRTLPQQLAKAHAKATGSIWG